MNEFLNSLIFFTNILSWNDGLVEEIRKSWDYFINTSPEHSLTFKGILYGF
jgi:hypothetical protein